MVRAWKFRSTVNAMLADIQGGHVRNIPSYVLPEQKDEISALVMLPMLAHYTSDISKLKLTNYYREGDHVWATVTAKQKDGSGVGQGKLRWQWDGKKWQFDALSSFVSAGLIGDEDDAQSIGDMAEHLLNGKTASGDAEDAYGQ